MIYRSIYTVPGYPRIYELGESDATHRTCIYRCFGYDDRLLYVGVTDLRPIARFVEHRRLQWWWPLVTRILVVYGYTRKAALACELASIQGEEPVYNKVGAIAGVSRKAGLWDAA